MSNSRLSRKRTRNGLDSAAASSRSRRFNEKLSLKGSRTRSSSSSVKRPHLDSSPIPSIESSTYRGTSSKESTYHVGNDELIEDDELGDLLGETAPEPEDRNEDDCPVRILEFFSIYDFDSGQLKPLPMDLNPDCFDEFYGGSGLVRPQLLDEEGDIDLDNEDEDEGMFVKLSAVRKVWTDGFEIWILTQFAWYVLTGPSPRYRPYYEEMMGQAQVFSRFLTRPSRAAGPSTSYVTPRVGKLAQGLFYRSLVIAGKEVQEQPEVQNICVPEVPFVVHDSDPETVIWGEKFAGAGGFYASVCLDGVEYQIGDTVAVLAPGPSKAENNLDAKCWFAQICYFFDSTKKGKKRSAAGKLFHGRWLSHGSQTILSETSNPQALFLLDECDDNPVLSIVQKITVKHLDATELEPVFVSDKDVGSSVFHMSYKWDPNSMTMSAVKSEHECAFTEDLGLACSDRPSYVRCSCCARRDQKIFRGNCNKLNAGELAIKGVAYHLHDFVYVKRKGPLLAIGHIVDLLPLSGTPELIVRLFNRVQTGEGDDQLIRQRLLVPRDGTKRICADSLDGKCHVRLYKSVVDPIGWTQGADNFLVSGLRELVKLKQCRSCESAEKKREIIRKVVGTHTKLRAMDLFSGAGGLTTGMDQSDFIKTCWAIELSSSAARSLKTNHPDIVVYNQDCGLLLKHAADLRDGKNPGALYALDGKKQKLPPLPARGEVDLIMGGPPCQPFSGMNRSKKVDDIRQTCIPTMLSFVEFYYPQYVLIENVTGILNFRLKGRQEGVRIVGGIESGMVKFIIRALTSLGYQCQLKVLNSADYGSPQQRNRVIFWGARLNLSLPKWPEPSHIPRGGHNNVIRRISNIGLAPYATRDEFEEKHEYAPFYSATVQESIGDLPSWDWKNPGILHPKTKLAPVVTKETFIAHTSYNKSKPEETLELAGYGYPILYATQPMNLYQLACRSNMSKFSRVEHHYTALFPPGTVERTVNIPVRPLADFTDLPPQLRKHASFRGTRETKPVHKTYVRLDPNGQFRTMMTSFSPASKGSAIIHPTDNRVLTVREVARAQGFPDTYEFCSVHEKVSQVIGDQYRQIGNAVPVHLAYALGKALGETLLQEELARAKNRH